MIYIIYYAALASARLLFACTWGVMLALQVVKNGMTPWQQ